MVQDAAAADYGEMPWELPPPPPPPPVPAREVLMASAMNAAAFGYTNALSELSQVDPGQVETVVQDLLTSGEATLIASIDAKDPETQERVTLNEAKLTLDEETRNSILTSGKDPATQSAMAFNAAWNNFAAANYVTGVPKAYGVNLAEGPISHDDPVDLKEITQFRDQDTCEAATIQRQLAKTDPAGYNLVMRDLLTQGYAAIPGYPNGVIQLDEANKAWINDPANGLSDAEKKNAAFQASMTGYLNAQSGSLYGGSTSAVHSLATGDVTVTTTMVIDVSDPMIGYFSIDNSFSNVTRGGPVRQAEAVIEAQGGEFFSLPQADQQVQGEFLRTMQEIQQIDAVLGNPEFWGSEEDITAMSERRQEAEAKLAGWDHGAARQEAFTTAFADAVAEGKEGMWVAVRTQGDPPPDPTAGLVGNGGGNTYDLFNEYTKKGGGLPPPVDPNIKYHLTQVTGIQDGIATLEDASGFVEQVPVDVLMGILAKSDDVNAGAGGTARSQTGGGTVRR
jgi:hypothetical protein